MQQYIDALSVVQSCYADDIALRSRRIGTSFWCRLDCLRIHTTRNMDNLLGAESVRSDIGVAARAEHPVECVRFAQKVQHCLAQWQLGKMADITCACRPVFQIDFQERRFGQGVGHQRRSPFIKLRTLCLAWPRTLDAYNDRFMRELADECSRRGQLENMNHVIDVTQPPERQEHHDDVRQMSQPTNV